MKTIEELANTEWFLIPWSERQPETLKETGTYPEEIIEGSSWIVRECGYEAKADLPKFYSGAITATLTQEEDYWSLMLRATEQNGRILAQWSTKS